MFVLGLFISEFHMSYDCKESNFHWIATHKIFRKKVKYEIWMKNKEMKENRDNKEEEDNEVKKGITH